MQHATQAQKQQEIIPTISPTCEWSQPCKESNDLPFFLPTLGLHATKDVLNLTEPQLMDQKMVDLGASTGNALM